MSSSSPGDPSAFQTLCVHRQQIPSASFQSLYDMFVRDCFYRWRRFGTTACREVAEELELVEQSHLSADPFFRCIVCTATIDVSHTLLLYHMDTPRKNKSWQEEEVAWGGVPTRHRPSRCRDRSYTAAFRARGRPVVNRLLSPQVREPNPLTFLTTVTVDGMGLCT
jgi:hypothetical protein